MSKLKDAWELMANYCLLASSYDDVFHIKGQTVYENMQGLCCIARQLHHKKYINHQSYLKIEATISKLKTVELGGLGSKFKFKRSLEGWRKRYQFCMKQAGKM